MRVVYNYISRRGLADVRHFLRKRHFALRLANGRLVQRISPPEEVIAVTGGVGKTSASAMIGAILERKGRTYTGLETNTPPAISKTLASIGWRTRYWVQEVSGAYRGQLLKANKYMRASVAVVTAVTGDHIKSFDDLDDVAKEKGSIAASLPDNGLAVLNADDPRVFAIKDRCRCRVLTYGKSEQADIRVLEFSEGLPDRLQLTVTDGTETRTIHTRFVGRRWITSIVGAIATARGIGIPFNEIAEAIEAFEPYLFRDSVHTLADGTIYLLDCHKNSFDSFESGMEIVESSRIPRKTVIVGTMSGYRGSASSKYRNVAKKALEVADTVCFYGKQAHVVDKLAGDYPGRLHSFDDASVLNEFLNEHRQPGDLIYVKATRADHMDRLWLDRQKPIDCWLDACGRDQDCHTCERLYAGVGKENLPVPVLREV